MKRAYLPDMVDFIHRPRIDALYAAGLTHSLVLVIAGPGYGKTLSLSHYIKTADVRLIWLRITSNRANPAEFWEDFVRVSRREVPKLAAKLEALGFPASSGAFEQFRRLLAETVATDERVVLVVDRYEQIIDNSIIQFLNSVIDCDFPNFTLLILCNVKLPFAEVLPATGQFRIIDTDLAFDREEARALFTYHGVNAEPGFIDTAIKNTGGWPLALKHMVVSSSPSSPKAPEDAPAQIITDLYEQHYFRKYPENIQHQLIRLSTLPFFSMEIARFGMEDHSSALYNLLMQHAFTRYDSTLGIFEFQPLYHTFLKQKHTLVDCEGVQAFAGQWFMAHGMIQEAMDCYWNIADHDAFLAAMAQWPKTLKEIRMSNLALQRLLQIPRNGAKRNALVDFCIAFMHLNAGDVGQARERLLALVQQLEAAPDAEEKRLLLGDTCVALFDIAVYQNEDTGLEWLQEACALIPNGSRIHETASMAVGNNSVFYMPNSAAGQLRRMVEHFFACAPYADRVKNGCGQGFEYLFAGEAAYYEENMEQAATMFNSAMLKASRAGQHDIICNALWGLGDIEYYYANYKNALALLQQLTEYINSHKLTALYELRDCAIAWFYIQMDDLAQVPSWVGETMTGPDEMMISVGRNWLTTAYYLYAKGDLIRAQAVVLQMEALLDDKGRWREKLTLQIIKAFCCLARGETADFERAFRKVYEMVYGNNIKIAMADYGKDMMSAIEQIKHMGAAGYDMHWLDAVYKDALSFAKRLRAMRVAHRGTTAPPTQSSIALTKREDETLRHLAKGLSQNEIGKLMGISGNAVKKHLSKIYNKLGAINRADAIHIATINGLVDVLNN